MSRIEGELLGDTSMYRSKFQSALRFASSKKDYMEWLFHFFSKEKIPTSKNGVVRVDQYDPRIKKTYVRYRFGTKCSTQFHDLRNLWYNKNIKEVPPNPTISKNLLLHWWLGDGTISTRCGYFCTDSFSKEQVENLSKKVNKLVGTNIKCIERKNPNGRRVPRIYIPQKCLVKILDFIGPPPIESLSYKWRLKQ